MTRPTRFDPAGVQRWLLGAQPLDDGGQALIAGLVDAVRAHGLPLWRCSFSLVSRHPDLTWRTVEWREGGGVEIRDHHRAALGEPFFASSPLALLRRGASPVRVRLTADSVTFPVCRDLKAMGGTDYLAQGLPYSTGEIGDVSWATRVPEGFGGDAIEGLISLTPLLAQRIELASAYLTTRGLLQLYVGDVVARRIADGGFRRGARAQVEAVLWRCDLRGFGALSDRLPPEAAARALDEHVDVLAGTVMDAGGEVMALGETIVALFPVITTRRAACVAALRAAARAREALVALTARRHARGEEGLGAGIALHVGEVAIAAVGARNRLGVALVSPAANDAARLASIGTALGAAVVVSEAFREAGGVAAIELGRHVPPGAERAIRVFAIDDAQLGALDRPDRPSAPVRHSLRIS